jgi:hypothetical protein
MGRWLGVVALLVTGAIGLGLMYAVPQLALLWLVVMVGVTVWLAARSRVTDT